MAEFTKDIQTLTQQANTSPQLQTNTGSLATDVVSAVGFGFDLYRKNKADTALGEAKQQQASYNTRIAENGLKLRDFNLSVGPSGQGLSSNQARRKQSALLKSFGDAEMQASVIAYTNKLTGTNTSNIMTELDKAEEAESKAIIARQEKRQQQEVSVVTAAYTSGLAIGNPSEMTLEEMNKVELESARVQAETSASNAKLSRELAQATNTATKQNAENKIWSNTVGIELGNIAASDLGSFIKVRGGVSVENAPLIIDRLNEYKANITKVVYARAEQSETYVSPESISSMITNLETGVERTKDLFMNEDSLKALSNSSERFFMGQTVKMFNSPIKEDRDAASMLFGSKFIGLPSDVGDFGTMLEYVSGSLKGNVDPSNENFDAVMRNLPNMLTTNAPPTPASQDSAQKIIDGLLNNSAAKTKEAIKKGGLDAITKAVVAQGTGVISPQAATETADTIYKAAVPSLAGNIQRLLTQETKDNTMNNEFGTMGLKQNFENGYTFDIPSMQFKKIDRMTPRNAQVDQVNLLIKNTRSTFGVLGMDKTYVNGFDEDILTTLGMTPTE